MLIAKGVCVLLTLGVAALGCTAPATDGEPLATTTTRALPTLTTIASPGPEAAVWLSDDGLVWDRAAVDTPSDGHYSTINAVAAFGGWAMAVGEVREEPSLETGDAAVWISTTGGETWTRVPPPEGGYGPGWQVANDITVHGDRAVVVGCSATGGLMIWTAQVSETAEIAFELASLDVDQGRLSCFEQRFASMAGGRLGLIGEWRGPGNFDTYIATSRDGLDWSVELIDVGRFIPVGSSWSEVGVSLVAGSLPGDEFVLVAYNDLPPFGAGLTVLGRPTSNGWEPVASLEGDFRMIDGSAHKSGSVYSVGVEIGPIPFVLSHDTVMWEKSVLPPPASVRTCAIDLPVFLEDEDATQTGWCLSDYEARVEAIKDIGTDLVAVGWIWFSDEVMQRPLVWVLSPTGDWDGSVILEEGAFRDVARIGDRLIAVGSGPRR